MGSAKLGVITFTDFPQLTDRVLDLSDVGVLPFLKIPEFELSVVGTRRTFLFRVGKRHGVNLLPVSHKTAELLAGGCTVDADTLVCGASH